MTNRIQLEPEAQAFAEAAARSPLLFTLRPEMGRLALDEAQSGQVSQHPVDIEDLTIADGPSVQVALRILRPQHARTPLPVIVYIHGAECRYVVANGVPMSPRAQGCPLIAFFLLAACGGEQKKNKRIFGDTPSLLIPRMALPR